MGTRTVCTVCTVPYRRRKEMLCTVHNALHTQKQNDWLGVPVRSGPAGHPATRPYVGEAKQLAYEYCTNDSIHLLSGTVPYLLTGSHGWTDQTLKCLAHSSSKCRKQMHVCVTFKRQVFVGS